MKEPHEVDNSREGEGGQDCLSMANQEVHGPGSGIHIRPHGDGKRSLRKREPSLSIPPKCAGKWVSMYELAGRQITEWHAYWDTLGMWVQLGIIP